MVEPIRMNTTKHDSLVVVFRACLSSEPLRRPRSLAMTNAPSAPMAPPSVGVATPMKMVPSTRKISSRGGISTNVTRSAMRESRPRRNTLLITATTNASVTPAHMDTTTVSSSATCSTASPCHQECTATMCLDRYKATAVHSAVSTSNEGRPALPLSSRMVRASGGSAGTQVGLKMAKAITKTAYRPVSMKPGKKAPLYISPTLRPSWSARMMSTNEGGMICASVPEAAITPVAMRRS